MQSPTKLNRRNLLLGLGACAPLPSLLACSGTSGTSADTPPATGPATEAGSDPEAGSAAEGSVEPSNSWATGGTAAMSGPYADPFASGLGASCALTASATLGPCYEPTMDRKDISEGLPGLPTRMAFLVVDETCKPIPNAEVDIWHAAPRGVYSGAKVPAMCTLDDLEASKATWFRGKQTADDKGRVAFDTCFPGWYPGRTVHIHFTVRVNGIAAVTSQLGFDDRLVDDIVATQPIYKDRGPRDTTNQTDGLITGEYVFEAERQQDGVLLAWKALVVKLPG